MIFVAFAFVFYLYFFFKFSAGTFEAYVFLGTIIYRVYHVKGNVGDEVVAQVRAMKKGHLVYQVNVLSLMCAFCISRAHRCVRFWISILN